jgi:hypothetical protein
MRAHLWGGGDKDRQTTGCRQDSPRRGLAKLQLAEADYEVVQFVLSFLFREKPVKGMDDIDELK